MKYGNDIGGYPHTFKIPNELWISLKKLSKKSDNKNVQESIIDAVKDRTHEILHNIVDDLKLDQSKSRTVKIPENIWSSFKNICKTKKYHLHGQFLRALYDYEKKLRKEFVDGLEKRKG